MVVSLLTFRTMYEHIYLFKYVPSGTGSLERYRNSRGNTVEPRPIVGVPAGIGTDFLIDGGEKRRTVLPQPGTRRSVAG